jgi:TRAP-type C4-dicarboxylate transport system substrate-binding protein
MKPCTYTCNAVLFALALAIPAAYAQLPAATQTAIDQAAPKVLAENSFTLGETLGRAPEKQA